ncbi:hypothetical protein [Paludibaculum fermentans]|uniref:hypothetical protein n=1 Tax=Paludibaculum fermentans TaxID=1473598 RepID=UPI003EBCED6F
MTKRFNSNILIALCTACAMLAFARYHAYVAVSATTFYVAAAGICLLPVLYGLVRRKAC